MNKGYIYKIVIDGTTTIYVGSSTNFKKRRIVHKSDCFNENSKSYNFNLYKIIRNDYKITKDDYDERVKFECIEEVDFNERYELGAREKHFIDDLNPCGNMVIPWDKCKEEAIKERRTINNKKFYQRHKDEIKEKIKEYQEKNKEKIKERNKQYREKNKEKIKEYKREYREKNKEKNDEKAREYRKKNRDEINRKQREKYRLKKL